MANIVPIGDWIPQVHPSAFLAPTATLIGNVVIEADASVWFGAVLRADQNIIRVGLRSSIQDNVVIHCNEINGTIIHEDVNVGHGAVLEGCELHDKVLVGMNASVLDYCVMEEGSLLAAGGVLKERDRIPAWTLAGGIPAKPLKKLEGVALEQLEKASGHYQKLMKLYQDLGKTP